MMLVRLAEVLGEAPVPQGSWEREAVYVSAASKRRGVSAAAVAELPGVEAELMANGLLRITMAVPGRLLDDEVEPLDLADPWPDFPRTWDNPGFVVRYAVERAANARRWAGDLGVPDEPFLPELLDDPRDRAVLRVLAELPGRRVSRAPAWESYVLRLALAYHDAHEHAPAIPKGDEAPTARHTARVRLARAIHDLLQNIRSDGEKA